MFGKGLMNYNKPDFECYSDYASKYKGVKMCQMCSLTVVENEFCMDTVFTLCSIKVFLFQYCAWGKKATHYDFTVFWGWRNWWANIEWVDLSYNWYNL